MGALLALIARLAGSSAMRGLSDPLIRAYEAKLNAANDAERLAAERDIASLEARASIARIEASDRFSARRIGSLLVVVPFGLWFGGVYMVSILNGLFGWHLVILDVPPRIDAIAMLLVPTILASEVFGGAVSRLGIRRK
jgi:hypothetical protein